MSWWVRPTNDDSQEQYSEFESVSSTDDFQSDLPMEEAPITDYSDISDQMIDEIKNNSNFNLEQREVSVVYNARKRLECAKLYEMLINHNIFEGVSADKDAIAQVQNELKQYVVSRLEILMGLKKPERIETERHIVAELPFNDIEVDFLKQLAFKGTGGESANGQPIIPNIQTTQTQRVVEEKPKPIAPKPIVNKPQPVIQSPKPLVQQPPVKKPVVDNRLSNKPAQQQRPQQQVKKPVAKTSSNIEKANMIMADTKYKERPLSAQEAEIIARAELEKFTQEPGKREEQYVTVRPANALPPVSPEQAEMIMTGMAGDRLSSGSMNNFAQVLQNALKK